MAWGATMRNRSFFAAVRAACARLRNKSAETNSSVFARIAAIALAFALLAPSLFIVCEAHHDCTGDGCQVCQAIAVASAITHTAADVPAPSCVPALVCALVSAAFAIVVRTSATTLVSLKVRLDC